MAHDQDNLKLSNMNHQQADNPSSPPIDAPGAFTCFPKLPTELRLKIWRFANATGGRHVDLSGKSDCVRLPYIPDYEQEYPHLQGEPVSESEYHRAIEAAKRRFPQTLHVNQESRLETLNILTFFFQDPKKKHAARFHLGGCRIQPLWLDMEVDTACMDWDDLYSERDSPVVLGYIAKHAPNILQNIRKLEIRDTYMCIIDEDYIVFHKHMLKALLCFTSLEVLYITVSEPDISVDVMNDLKRRIKTWLDRQEGSSLKDTLSTIHVRELQHCF